jgi:hypothetical protein
MVIISNPPEQGSRLHGLLAKLLGKPSGECLGATQSEVWPVRDFIKQRVEYRLNQLGLKVTQLRENWNHILSRHGLPDTVSPVQEDMLANARKSPEVVGVAVMVAPEPAIAEYALTRRTDAPASGQGVPEGASTQIIIPINDTQHVTVRRIKAVTGEQGSTWRGQVEETGDSAILMWWKDGHLSGVFGYKGHIYSIVDMGDGQLHAVADPKKLPPDHAPASSDRARSSPTDTMVLHASSQASPPLRSLRGSSSPCSMPSAVCSKQSRSRSSDDPLHAADSQPQAERVSKFR